MIDFVMKPRFIAIALSCFIFGFGCTPKTKLENIPQNLPTSTTTSSNASTSTILLNESCRIWASMTKPWFDECSEVSSWRTSPNAPTFVSVSTVGMTYHLEDHAFEAKPGTIVQLHVIVKDAQKVFLTRMLWNEATPGEINRMQLQKLKNGEYFIQFPLANMNEDGTTYALIASGPIKSEETGVHLLFFNTSNR